MNEHRQRRFIEYLRIKSVANSGGIPVAHAWLRDWLATFCDSVETVGTVNPLIRARINGESDKTLCLYGHYDVQPAIKSDGWETEPFEPVVTDDMIIARGACDNKGQNFAFLCALEDLIRVHKKPRFSILILLEGEEEVGSPHLKEYMLQDKLANKADYYLLVDGTSPRQDRPALYTGSLGVVFGEISADNHRGDLHSGIFGKEAMQPVTALTSVIQGLYNNDLALDFGGVADWSFSVNHLSAGSDVAKVIIPGRASAMVSYRFSTGVEPATIITSLQNYCAENASARGIDITFSPKVAARATQAKPDWLHQECVSALKKIGLAHVAGQLQGTLPVASIIKDIYNADSLILSFGSKHNHTHGPNESMAKQSIEHSIAFFGELLR